MVASVSPDRSRRPCSSEPCPWPQGASTCPAQGANAVGPARLLLCAPARLPLGGSNDPRAGRDDRATPARPSLRAAAARRAAAQRPRRARPDRRQDPRRPAKECPRHVPGLVRHGRPVAAPLPGTGAAAGSARRIRSIPPFSIPPLPATPSSPWPPSRATMRRIAPALRARAAGFPAVVAIGSRAAISTTWCASSPPRWPITRP